jgi:uncharacterized protein
VRGRLSLLIALAAASVTAGGPAAARVVHVQVQPAVLPALTGRVVDSARILSAPVRARLAGRLAALEHRTTDQVVVVTLPSLDGRPIEAVGWWLGNGWHIGRAKVNNGVLLVIAPNERKVRISVGAGLNGLLTDQRASAIIQQRLIPFFRTGNYDQAAEAGVAEIVRILESDSRRPRPRMGGTG